MIKEAASKYMDAVYETSKFNVHLEQIDAN